MKTDSDLPGRELTGLETSKIRLEPQTFALLNILGLLLDLVLPFWSVIRYNAET